VEISVSQPHLFTALLFDRRVTWANRMAWVQAVESYKRTEFVAQCEAMRRGLGSIVPLPLLAMFSWSEARGRRCNQ
jgi:hypothetical protein